MEVLVPLVIIAVLVLLNGMFVAAEFAIIGAPRATIERRAREGHAVAKLVRRVLSDPRRQDRYIATAQLGITLASLGLGMYGEHTVAHWLGEWLHGLGMSETGRWISAHALASILAVAILTYLHIVVGEMMPKSIALLRAEPTVLGLMQPMRLIQLATYPLVAALNGLGNGLLRLIGVRREVSASHYHTPEELQYIVRESQEGGLLRAEAGQILRDLFEFGGLTAGEAMVPRVHVAGLPLGVGPDELRRRLLDARHTRYPVYEGDLDHVVGVVHIKDILRLVQANQALTMGDVRPTAFVPETMELDRVIEAMHGARTQLVVVMDEHGGTAGILSIEDLGAEAIGEVEEGHDEEPDVVREGDGRIHVAGTVRLDEIGELFDRTVEHEEVDTVSGLVLALLERPPVVGDVVTCDGVRFEVTEVEGHGVERCVVCLLPPEEPAPEEDDE
ncbi:MAG TPA: hemolysin family protein [Rubricoccaceae bacterium]|nr:hemolysin family protein [Rubricoccaceae bacterium]